MHSPGPFGVHARTCVSECAISFRPSSSLPRPPLVLGAHQLQLNRSVTGCHVSLWIHVQSADVAVFKVDEHVIGVLHGMHHRTERG